VLADAEHGRVEPGPLGLDRLRADDVPRRAAGAPGQRSVDPFDVVDLEAGPGRPRPELTVTGQHEQQVRPEALDRTGDLRTGTLPDRDEQHHRHDPDQDPEGGQRRPQPVGA
jgi:hypothetical protein